MPVRVGHRQAFVLVRVLACVLACLLIGATDALGATPHQSRPLAGSTDRDGDGLPDTVEVALGLDPRRVDTDGDGVHDGAEDTDHDRLTNLFEYRQSKTDPGDADSDNDGIRDGLEDPDKDGLSNAGEQRFSTDPRVADTDGDGRDDWHEDSDHDHVADGLRQDAGPLPSPLRPTLAAAAADVASISLRNCHSRSTSTAARTCTFTYGPAAGRKRVVLTGDSHAVHWFPALQVIAERRGWQLITLTKSSCPFVDVLVFAKGAPLTACSTWRQNAWARIRQLQPDMVVVTSLDGYAFLDHGAETHSATLWQAGMERSLRQLRAAAPTVVVLGDVFHWGAGAVSCLKHHASGDISLCELRRDGAAGRTTARRDVLASHAAAATGSVFHATRQILCPVDPCPLVVDGRLVTRDGSHMTATYSALIWRALDRILPRP